MAVRYVRFYGMLKVRFWTGDLKPDAPSLSSEKDPDLSDSKVFNSSLDTIEIEDGNFFGGTENDPTDKKDTAEGFVGVGVNVQEALYQDANLRKVLRLLRIGEISRKYPKTQFITANNFKESESLGAFQKASITIKAVNKDNVYPLYGALHTTTILISSCASLPEIASFFSRNSFKVGSEEYLYKIVPDSVKLITSRTVNSPIC